MESSSPEWNLAELAQASGVAPRTIRYYISRGLLPGPNQVGRSASYGREHLVRLQEIVRQQRAGASLAEISALGAPRSKRALEASAWWRYELSSDLAVEVRNGLAPWRMKRIRTAIAELARILEQEEE